jgi:alpha-tubulin suppressor-like RCC1 family protein
MTKFVTMAFAATHYSLALSSDGNIYEWGMYILIYIVKNYQIN